MTPKQARRQRSRSSNGRYTEHYSCLRCGKNATEDYWSDKRTDDVLESGYRVYDAAICLCEACARHTNSLDDAAFQAELESGNWGSLPRPKLPRIQG